MLRNRIVKPERRHLERPTSRLAALGEVVPESPWAERRVQCWNLEPKCTEESRRRCSAYFVRRNCWDLWAAEYFPPGRKPCCHPDRDCSDCSITAAKFKGDIAIYVETPAKASRDAEPSTSYCQHLYSPSQPASKMEIDERYDFKCRRRPGILLHETYVSDVCSCLEHRDCVFYEAD